jgi:hypothetical protein
MICISVDPGFGNFKVATVASGSAQVAVVPSVVGVGETDLGMLSLGDLGSRRRRNQPDRVTSGGVTYLVGEEVARFARPVQRMDFLRLSDGPELRALFYAAVFRLGQGDHRDAALIVGLPVEVMGDRDLARDTLRALKGWLVARHRFSVNGQAVALDVVDVRVMAQPAGAFFAWGMSDQGRWIRPRSDLKAPVAVCDVGFNTLDLFAVEGGDVVARFTDGDSAGMRRAAEMVINGVRGKYQVELSLHEADALLVQKRPRLYTSEGEVNLLPLVKQALDTAAAGIVTYVERRWDRGRQFAHLLFTGGGAELLREALLRQYPHGVVLPKPVAANAIGLARYAVRVFKPTAARRPDVTVEQV